MKAKGYWLVAVIALFCLFGWTGYGQTGTEQKPQPRWEYSTMTVADYQGTSLLNNAGEKGWELVSVTQLEGENTKKQYYFKRAK